MKYLKLFEEIDFTLEKSPLVYLYRFNIDKLKLYVRFLATIKNKVYIRRYNIDTPEDKFITGYGKKDKILSGVTEITKQFIKDVKPNCIVIPHIAMKFETGELDSLNKRAKMNYEYLKTIEGYHLEYYNSLYTTNGEEKTMTYCFLSKNGYKPDVKHLIPKDKTYKGVL